MPKEILRTVFGGIGVILAAGLALDACGGSGTVRPGSTAGTTGSTGSAGTTGSGGTAGGGGGTGGAAALSCTANPTMPLLTDFTSATLTAAGQWGTPGNLTGHTFGYHGSMTGDGGTPLSSIAATLDRTASNLKLAGTVAASDFAGGGMSFDTCVNSTTWTGVEFTLAGTADGCTLTFQLQTLSQEPPENKGTCTASSCYSFPQTTIQIPTDGSPTVIKFADLATTGLPSAAADFEKEMFGLQWQFTSAVVPDGGVQVGCLPDMTITNVMWVSN